MSLPMFPPGDGPGPSFTELLRRVGLDPPAAHAPGGNPPMELRHGTTIAALRFAEGGVMAGDRRATDGPRIARRALAKALAADRHPPVPAAAAARPSPHR